MWLRNGWDEPHSLRTNYIYLKKKTVVSQGLVAHTFNPSNRGTEAGGSL